MRICVLFTFMLMAISAASMADVPIVESWRYTLQQPQPGWERADFDDGPWRKGSGGFGTRGTPAARVGTLWGTSDIWLRKSFEVGAVPAKAALLIHHDEDAEVYINGKRVAALSGYTTDYQVIPLGDAERKTVRAGQNTMAVHCQQTDGGQFIDVHLVDADNVPKLPIPKRDTTPFESRLITKWGEHVTAENAWTEYPRPQMARERWTNLNGHWQYAITDINQKTAPSAWTGKILVPFCLESRLGGVQRLLEPTEALWYRRTFQASPRADYRTLLNFEAVDYRCEVLVNGKSVGTHQGGHTPFTIDVSDALRAGRNELVVRVEDETEAWQLRGKQVLFPRGIWYTQVSGIWQTVWLEEVAPTYLRDLKIDTDVKKRSITIKPSIGGGNSADMTLRVTVKDGSRTVADVRGNADNVVVRIPDAKLWSPESPHLYDLTIALIASDGSVLDTVDSYAGIRAVGRKRDADGHWRFTLNGSVVFHWGPLDQGWWPDGLLTPPSDEGMAFDIEFVKAAGFNAIRKHIKVEPRRYYYHCDRVGLLVWQDQVSAGHNPPWTRLRANPSDAVWPDEQHNQFMDELEQMVDTLENHPSIVVWVPFNEAWGQHRTVEVGKWTTQRDPSRLVNIASGGNFWPVGHIVDHHNYPHPDFPFETDRYDDFIKVIGELGGHGYPVRDHLWDAERRNWGYGGLPRNKSEYKQRYVQSINLLNDFRRRGIAAGIYTQTTDVEGEINGLLTYDRKVIKIPADELAELHRRLFE